MIDKIIRIAEIAIWVILGLFVIGIGYMLLSYVISFIDFKPNSVGPKFLVDRKFETSYFEINEEAKEYFDLKVENFEIEVNESEEDDDAIKLLKSYVTVSPKKVTPNPINVEIREMYKETEELDAQEINFYRYELNSVSVAVNKLVATIDESIVTKEIETTEVNSEEEKVEETK